MLSEPPWTHAIQHQSTTEVTVKGQKLQYEMLEICILLVRLFLSTLIILNPLQKPI